MVSRRQLTRGWWALTALVALSGVLLQLVVTSRTTGGFFPANPQRVLNVFAYFTVQSNLLVGITSLLLALRPEPGGALRRTLRLDALVGISVTGVVFHLVLRSLQDLQGLAAFADLLLHTASPLLTVVGWLLLGPRGRVDRRVAAWSVVFPVAWLSFTLVRGVATGFWPYPFVDVDELGLGRVLVNCLVVAVLFGTLALGAVALDRRLPGASRTAPSGPHA